MKRPSDDLGPLISSLLREPEDTYRAIRAHYPPGEQERTSFRLTPAAAEARDWLVDHLQVSQRALFDRVPFYLDEAARAYEPERLRSVLAEIGDEGERRTYVVSQHTLDRIGAHADHLGATRDAVVSFALVGMQYLVERGTELARRRRARFGDEVERLAHEVRRLRDAAAEQLDPDDALQYRLAAIAADIEVLAKQLNVERHGGPPLSRRPR